MNMNKFMSSFLSASLLLSTSFAGPIVNKLGKNPYSAQISLVLKVLLEQRNNR